jgi:hypothetical protein
MLDYTLVNDQYFQKQQGFLFSFFLISLNLFSPIIIFVLYVLLRQKRKISFLSITTILFLIEIILLIIISLKISRRLVLVSIIVGIIIYEIQNLKSLNLRFLLKSFLFLSVFFILVDEVFKSRNPLVLYSKVLHNDYLAPSKILFTAIAYNIVDPVEVIKSNFFNSLIMFHYPYLWEIVLEESRIASSAIYILSEGYLFLGSLGFIYNGLIIFCGIGFWRSMALSNNKNYNNFILGLFGISLVAITRGQSCYFFKYFYFYFLQGVFLYYLATGLIPKPYNFLKFLK